MKNKHLTLLILIVIVSCLSLIACDADNQKEHIAINGFDVILYEPETDFPESITFEVKAESNTTITKLTLQYEAQRILSIFDVTSVSFPDFEPANEVKTSWKWDLTKTGSIPPGVEITYWWQMENIDGDVTVTPKSSMSFKDAKYPWKSIGEGNVELFWYQGSESFAGQLMAAAQSTLSRLSTNTGAELDNEVAIYIYAGSQDLQGALIFPQEWTGGVAFTEFGTIAIGISTTDLDWGKRAIAHELAHLVVHQMTFSGYGISLPTWLDEGLAVYAEGELSSTMESVLVQAIANDNLLSVQILSSPFSAETQKAYLSYAQSYSLVEYLISVHGGGDKMSELLMALKQGSNYVEALDQIYSLSLEELDDLWRDYAAQKYLGN